MTRRTRPCAGPPLRTDRIVEQLQTRGRAGADRGRRPRRTGPAATIGQPDHSVSAATSFIPQNPSRRRCRGCHDRRPEIATEVRLLGSHGSPTKYVHQIVGVSRVSTRCVVLRAKLARLAKWNELRREAAARYAELLADLPGCVSRHRRRATRRRASPVVPPRAPAYHAVEETASAQGFTIRPRST